MMPRSVKPPRLLKWRGVWHLFYFDHQKQKQRRIRCSARRAHTGKAREKLLEKYTKFEKDQAAEAVLLPRLATDYDKPLLEALGLFNEDLEERKQEREANPRARAGISVGTFKLVTCTLTAFESWLVSTGQSNLRTGDLDARHLQSFIRHLASNPAKRGKKKRERSAATLNNHRSILLRALTWLNQLRPKLFPDFDSLKAGLKPQRTQPPQPRAFTPDELNEFLRVARLPAPVLEVSRTRGGRKETFEQRVAKVPATPIDRLFLLLALTGMRLGEVLALKWDSVDIERGRIALLAQKTGHPRTVPLRKSTESVEIAPRFADLLKAWKEEAGKRKFVLPHEGLKEPHFPRKAWESIARKAKVADLTPQSLRQNFVSYCASCGVTSAVAAGWAGHREQVAERYYRAQVLDRLPGKNIEDAMGLKLGG